MGLSSDDNPMAVALDYCHTVNSNIGLFLRDKTKTMVINLEDIHQDFPAFWKLVGAEGELDAALAEFNNCYNTRKMPQVNKNTNVIPRILLKIKRIITKLPRYIKDA